MKPFDCLDPTLELQGTHAIDASAGTGKTFAIEHLVTRLLLEGASLDQILVVTFTRAATRELKKRIHSNIETLFQNPPPYVEALKDKERAERTLYENLIRFDEAQIFTIHGFCQRMLAEYSFEADSQLETQSEQKEDYRTLLLSALTDFLQTNLNETSYSAKQLHLLMKEMQFDKDRLTQKLLPFIEEEGSLPTFPDYQTSLAEFKTLHPTLPKISIEKASAFLKICDRQGVLHDTYLKQLEALNTGQFDQLLASPSLFSFFTPENRSKKTFSDAELKPFYHLYQTLAPLIETAANPKHTLMRIAKEAKHKVRQALLDEELFTPNDLLLMMEEALNRPAFANAVHSRYQAVIIDEFQDTDPHQWNIFKTLFVDREIPTFYIVGDPKQSIYGFRSADLPTYMSAKKTMKHQGELTTNYRSEPALLSALNHLFEKQTHFPYLPLNPRPNKGNTPFSDSKKPLHFFHGEAEKNREKNWPSKTLENDLFFPFIAKEIQALTEKNEASFGDFAILVKDRYQASRLKHYLSSLNIPIAAKSIEPLKDSPLFSLIEHFLLALIHPKNVRSFLAHPLFGLTHLDLKNDTALLAKASAFFHHHQTDKLEKALDAALYCEWKPNLTLLDLLAQKGELDSYSDCMQLIELLIEEARQTHATASELLHRLKNLPSHQAAYCRRPLRDLNAVTIMTIHMSKGLEFPIVFVLGLMNRYTTPQSFVRHQKKWLLSDPDHPSCQAALQNEQAEKMRQLYVALTRAKKRLYVASLKDLSRALPKQETRSPLELFFTDLPPIQKLEHVSCTLLEKTTAEPISKPSPTLIEPLTPRITIRPHSVDSFSSLSHHTPPPAPELPEEELPKETETGILLHALLEKIIRANLTHPYSQKAIHHLIDKSLSSTPFSPYTSQITRLIDAAFHLPLESFTLADIPPAHLHPEIEFLYSKSPSQSLKGFTDLIFFHEEAYYILDWKTNVLPDYAPSALQEALTQNDYHLQATIYMEALQRYLTQTRSPYPLKGAYYLFLRGLPRLEGLIFLPNPA